MSDDHATAGMSAFEGRREVPSIGTVVRTPESRFAAITDYPWPPQEVEEGGKQFRDGIPGAQPRHRPQNV